MKMQKKLQCRPSTVMVTNSVGQQISILLSTVLVSLLLLSPAVVASNATNASHSKANKPQHCPNYQQYKQPFFGDTHVHSGLSFDAVTTGVLDGPDAGYAFARGARLGLNPNRGYDGDPAGGIRVGIPGTASIDPNRIIQIDRPLDFAVISDHAELFGETKLCLETTQNGIPDFTNTSDACVLFQADTYEFNPAVQGVGFAFFGINTLINGNRIPDVCGPDGALCLDEADNIWQLIQAEANAANDACNFTALIGYEWTAIDPIRDPIPYNNLHRNVIFSGDNVPDSALSSVETGPNPDKLWAYLQSECVEGLEGCDAITIPHNSSASRGLMFKPELFNENTASYEPLTNEQAMLWAQFDKLVEITQNKGDSECRQGIGGAIDEECNYEKLDTSGLFAVPVPNTNPPVPLPFDPLIVNGGNPVPGVTYDVNLAYTRGALKEGLLVEDNIGVNPFKFGVIGSTDTHNNSPGFTAEADYQGGFSGAGSDQLSALLRLSVPAQLMGQFVTAATDSVAIGSNPGGLAVLWAEENTRGSLFNAMKKREAYATSGNRPIVRFFGGWQYPLTNKNVQKQAGNSGLCASSALVKQGYQNGVPMGSNLPDRIDNKKPRFIIHALQDPIRAPLERIQIIKGWVDGNGQVQEKVVDVAGSKGGPGHPELCVVWQDDDFKADEDAFYYARILEVETRRWHKILCEDRSDLLTDPTACDGPFLRSYGTPVQEYIQERAWTSPIWYEAKT